MQISTHLEAIEAESYLAARINGPHALNLLSSSLMMGEDANIGYGKGVSLLGCDIYMAPNTELLIGEYCQLRQVSIEIRRQRAKIKIGSHCRIDSGTKILSDCFVEIGDFSIVERNCYLTDSQVNFLNAAEREQYLKDLLFFTGQAPLVSSAKLFIGERCWLRNNTSVILAKEPAQPIWLPEGTIVEANSTIKESVESCFCIVGGNPAKIIGFTRADSTNIAKEQNSKPNVYFYPFS